MKRILLFCLIGLTALSCKLEDHVTPTDTCQLAQFLTGGGLNEFTYDPAGSLTNWVIITPVSASTTDVVHYDFTRDATGRISSLIQTRTFEGKLLSSATAQFIYTNGLLTSTSTTVDPAKPGSILRTFSYDSQGHMSQRLVYDQTSGFSSTETYAYDSRGNCTRYTYTDSYGVTSEFLSTYDMSKNPEQLLIKSIPFNLLTGQPWSINVVLATKDTFDDGTGAVTYTSQRTGLTTGANGYVSNVTLTYDDGFVAKTAYSLINCQ